MENEYYRKKISKLEKEREEQIAGLSPENLKEFQNFERQYSQNQENINPDKTNSESSNLRLI